MWPFKPKVSLEDFCRDFYDKYVYQQRIGGVDVTGVYWDEVFEDVSRRFPSRLDRDAFHREMTATYFELFGLAWQLAVRKDDLAVKQSAFTKRYLEEKGELALWQSMGDYNHAIAQSFEAVRSTGARTRRATTIFDTSYRLDMFKKWTKSGFDDECTARVVSRMGLKLDIQAAQAMIAGQLLTTLGQDDISFDDTVELRAVFYGLFEGARKAIKSVSIQA